VFDNSLTVCFIFVSGSDSMDSPKKKFTLSADAPVFVPKFTMSQSEFEVSVHSHWSFCGFWLVLITD